MLRPYPSPLHRLHGIVEKIIAKDINNNETERTFSFQTERYYLKFLKKYDYGIDNDGIPYSIIKTIVDNYLIAGYYWPPTGISRLFVQKTDYEGNEIWKKFYDFDGGKTKIIKDNTGFLILGPRILLKIDNDGVLIWSKEIVSSDPQNDILETESLAIDSNGNIFIVSNTRTSYDPEILQDGIIIKLDNFGNLIWEKLYRRNSIRSMFYDLVINSENELVILGVTETNGISVQDFYNGSPSEQIDYWILKTDNNGDEIWSQIYGDNRFDFALQIIQKNDGNYAFAGYSWGGYDISNGRIFEIDQSGNEIWSVSSELSNIFSIAETLDNGIVSTGHVIFGDFGALGIYKFDSNGNEEWNKTHQESFTYLYGRSILTEQDGGYRVAGRLTKNYYYGDEKPSILIYKTDPEGNFE